VIKIEFVHYTETKTGTSYHTVSELKSVKVDPQSVKGIDYHSIESRKARFSFYDESSFFNTNFLTNWSYISGTKYNIFAIRLSKDDVTDYIGYVKPDNVIYDVKTGMVDISATDILGVLLDIADTDNDYNEGTHNVNTLLQSEITGILSGFDVDYSDTSDNITYEMSDFEIVYSNYENFEEVIGYNGLVYDAGGGVYGGGTYTGRIRSVVYDGSKFIVKICDYYEDIDRDESEYHDTIDYVYFEINTDLFIDAYYYRHLEGVYDDENHLWDNWANGSFGTETSSSSATNGDDTFNFGTATNGARFYFTGDLTLEEINLDADEDVTYITKNRKDIIKALLLLLNAGIRIDKDGDITVEDKDLVGTGTDIDSYTLDNKKGFILHSEKDFNSMFSFISGSKNLAKAITDYYNNLFETFKYEYNLAVNSDISLALGDTITSDGKDMRIVEIDEPYNDNIYYIKAWGE